MKKILALLFSCILLLFSCKKSSSGGSSNPGNPNNQLKAMVSVMGGTPFPIDVNGNNTVFVKQTINGDFIIDISGGISEKNIHITLSNINATGNYPFSSGGTPQYAFCTYITGTIFGTNPYIIYGTLTPPPPSGSVTITELTSGSISGTFNATCVNGGGQAEITTGSFKGNF